VSAWQGPGHACSGCTSHLCLAADDTVLFIQSEAGDAAGGSHLDFWEAQRPGPGVPSHHDRARPDGEAQ
jgi:hypothetical protein